MLSLYPHQTSLVDRCRASMNAGHRRVLLVSPCGSGKTVAFSYFAQQVTKRRQRTMIMAHRDELVEQISDTLKKFEVEHSFIAAGRHHDPRPLVQVGSVMSVARRLDRIPKPHVVINDEGHHDILGSTWEKIFEKFPQAWKIGVTATPERLGGESLKDTYDDMILGPTVAELIRDGFLCPFKVFAPSSIDTSGLHMRGGDFARNELALASDKPSITGNAIDEWEKLAKGKRTVVYCVDVQHARNVAAEFRAAGHSAACIDGKMGRDARKSLVAAFREGSVMILTSVDVVSEGFDLPAIEAVVMLRPTASSAWWIQASGRALRTHPGKDLAYILDHAGNVLRHGLPDDERDWSLEGRVSRKSGNKGPAVRVCPSCFAAQRAGPPMCKFCGDTFPVKARKVQEIEGKLIEVDSEILSRHKKADINSESYLVRLGKRRGYRNPEKWAHHIMQAKQRKRLLAGRQA